jgi:hypothetical protein
MSHAQDQSRDRWVGIGNSNEGDARKAGFEAASEALEGRDAKLLIVFCSDSYDLEQLLDGVGEVAGGAPLVGCSTAGEIASSGPYEASIVVTALGGEGFSVTTAMAGDASSDMRAAGTKVAETLSRVEDREHKVLLLLSDGLAGDQQELIRGAYGVLGADVSLVGGCAGDDLKMKSTAQFFNGSVLTNSLVGAAISSVAPLGIGVRHGWQPVGDPMMVTSSGNNRVYTLDDQPALDVYLERLKAPEEARQEGSAFTRFAMTHPLGLKRRAGETQVRLIADADFEDRSLGSIAEVPQGGIVWLMHGDDKSVLEATSAACVDALEGLEGRDALGLIAFDCVARRGVLDDSGLRQEVDRIVQHAKGAPVAGFYSYGEIARTSGVSGFHNQTLVVLAVG